MGLISILKSNGSLSELILPISQLQAWSMNVHERQRRHLQLRFEAAGMLAAARPLFLSLFVNTSPTSVDPRVQETLVVSRFVE